MLPPGGHAKKHLINDLRNHKPVAGTTSGNVVVVDANGLPTEDSGTSLSGLLGGLIYQGTWDATNPPVGGVPTLVDGTGVQGHFYQCSADGTQDLGSGPISFVTGDWILYNGAIWQKVDHTDQVLSVDGMYGDVDLSGNYSSLTHAAQHTDGTDDVQDATSLQKGLMTIAQASKLDLIEDGADVTGDHQGDVELANLGEKNHSSLDQLLWSAAGHTLDDAVEYDLTAGLVSPHDHVGRIQTLTAGSAIDFPNICQMSADGKYDKAQGNAEATASGKLAVPLSALADAGVGQFAVDDCYLRDDTWAWATPGAKLYLDPAVAGGLLDVLPPLVTGNIIRIVGYVVSATIIHFCPDRTFIEVA